MKLLFCPDCGEVRSFGKGKKAHCECGKSWGMYLPGSNDAVMGGRTIPLGLAHRDIPKALASRGKYPVIRCWLYDVDHTDSHISRAQTNAGKTEMRLVEAELDVG